MVDVLCRGLADSKIQMDQLGDPNQEMTVEQALRFIEAKEAGKRSAARLSLPHTADAVGSSYKLQERPPTPKGPPPKEDSCSYCGGRGHGKSAPTRIRRIECPAYGSKCNNCGKDHHTKKMCRSDSKQHENTLFDTMCHITSSTS